MIVFRFDAVVPEARDSFKIHICMQVKCTVDVIRESEREFKGIKQRYKSVPPKRNGHPSVVFAANSKSTTRCFKKHSIDSQICIKQIMS